MLCRGLQIGMVFQSGALFDSLTVGENVGFLLYEHSDLPEARIKVRPLLAMRNSLPFDQVCFLGLSRLTSMQCCSSSPAGRDRDSTRSTRCY